MSVVDESPWVRNERAAAAERARSADAPDTAEEVWRYSRIDDVDLDAFEALDSPSASGPDPIELSSAAVVLQLRDGHLVERTGDVEAVFAGPATAHPDGESIVRASWADDPSKVELTHRRGLGSPILIDVPRRTHVAGVVQIDHYSDGDATLTAPHTIVRAAAGSSVTVFEHRRSSDAPQLVVPRVRIEAEADARINYVVVQELGRSTISIERVQTSVGQQGHVVTGLAAFGGSYARTRSDFRLEGRGASGDLLAVYFGDEDQMLDFRTFQEHAAPDTTSNLLFKGAVTGSAQSVYTGLIRVAETAPGTDAYQTNRNLKLSDDAWAYSVPNLEIEQNQVSCSHASTVGEIDENQRFYLESRGVPTTEAEQLLVSGFFAEVIEALPVAEIQPRLRRTVDDALAADRENATT